MFGFGDYRGRRRLIIIIAICLLLVLGTAYLIVGRLIGFYSPDEARVYELSQIYAGDPVAAFGFNIESIASSNLVQEGGFEPDVLQYSYPAIEGTENSFVISSLSPHDPDKKTEDFYEDAVVRIYSQTQERLSLRHEAEITDYLAGQVLDSRQILLPAEMPETISLRASAEYDGKIMICGDGGYIVEISREGESRLHNTGHDAELISIAGGPTGWLALAEDGSYYLSADARAWERYTLPDSRLNKAISVFKDGRYFFLAAGDKGSFYRISYVGAEKIELELENDLHDLLYWEGQIIICGSDGLITVGDFDYQFNEIKGLSPLTDWLSLDANHEGIVCCGTLGGMAYSAEGTEFVEIDPLVMADVHGVNLADEDAGGENIIWPNLVGCARVNDEAVLFQTATGESWLSNYPDSKLEKSPYFSGHNISLIKSLSSGRLLAVHGDNSIEMANLGDIISFEPALEYGVVESGDLLFFEKQAFFAPFSAELIADKEDALAKQDEEALLSKSDGKAGIWHLSQGTVMEHLPNSGSFDYARGDGCLKISYSGAEIKNKDLLISQTGDKINSVYNKMPSWLNARIAQRLDLTGAKKLDDSFYRLEIYLRQEGLASNSVYLWLSGLGTGVSGHTVEKLGSKWEKHEFIFVLGQQKADSEVWLNIGFAGAGSLWLDQIWFGSTQDEASELPLSLKEHLTELEPEVLRLGFAPIGAPGHGNHSWLLPEGSGCRLSVFAPLAATEKEILTRQASYREQKELHNLGAALKLSQQLDTDPWLVIDAMATDAELYHLIEYLAGASASEYGQLRLAQGAVGRWSDQLGRFYLEIQDSADIFSNDTARMIYVNHVIDTIRSAPDYAQLENKFVLVDGMNYDGGVLASKADYHAGELTAKQMIENYGDMRTVLSDFLRSMPTRRILGGSNAPEMIKSFSWQEGENISRMADYASLIFAEAGQGINLVLCDLQDQSQTAYYRALSFAGQEISGKWALSSAVEKLYLDREEDNEELENELTIADVELDPEAEELILLSFTDGDLRTVILINLGNKNVSLRLGGSRPIVEGEIYSYDARASLLAKDKIKSSRHIYRVLPGGMAVLVEDKDDDAK